MDVLVGGGLGMVREGLTSLLGVGAGVDPMELLRVVFFEESSGGTGIDERVVPSRVTSKLGPLLVLGAFEEGIGIDENEMLLTFNFDKDCSEWGSGADPEGVAVVLGCVSSESLVMRDSETCVLGSLVEGKLMLGADSEGVALLRLEGGVV
jgi:hypothetical protein